MICFIYVQNARNYVTSDLPVGEPLSSRFEFSANAERVSAGKHAVTIFFCFIILIACWKYTLVRITNKI